MTLPLNRQTRAESDLRRGKLITFPTYYYPNAPGLCQAPEACTLIARPFWRQSMHVPRLEQEATRIRRATNALRERRQ